MKLLPSQIPNEYRRTGNWSTITLVCHEKAIIFDSQKNVLDVFVEFHYNNSKSSISSTDFRTCHRLYGRRLWLLTKANKKKKKNIINDKK